MNKKIALVTGASSGIGFDAAIKLQEAGFIVYGAARRIDKLKELKKYNINILQLDVTDEASMVSCVDTIINKEGRIDILVNNAGYGSFGPVETVSMKEARKQFDVNIFGLARMIQLVLPSMRKQKYGRIINISSMGGKVYTPYGGWYHATKFALEALSDCIRLETKAFGVDVVVIEPGGIKTEWGTIAANNLKDSTEGTVYATGGKVAAERMKSTYESNILSNPKIISKAVVKAATVKKPKTRYLLGFGAKPGVFMRRILSDRMYDRIIKKIM